MDVEKKWQKGDIMPNEPALREHPGWLAGRVRPKNSINYWHGLIVVMSSLMAGMF